MRGMFFGGGKAFFEVLRDGGPGWHFQKHDKSAVSLRVTMLLDPFRRRRNYTLSALTDFSKFAVADLQGEDSAAVGLG